MYSRGLRVQDFATWPIPMAQEITQTILVCIPMEKNPTWPVPTGGYIHVHSRSTTGASGSCCDGPV